MRLSQSIGLCLILFVAAKLGDSCSCAKPPSSFYAERAIVNDSDAFRLSNECYERLGDCRWEMGWKGSVEHVDIREIGKRRHNPTKNWWPVKADVRVLCRCDERSSSIVFPQSVYVTGDDKAGWHTTNAL